MSDGVTDRVFGGKHPPPPGLGSAIPADVMWEMHASASAFPALCVKKRREDGTSGSARCCSTLPCTPWPRANTHATCADQQISCTAQHTYLDRPLQTESTMHTGSTPWRHAKGTPSLYANKGHLQISSRGHIETEFRAILVICPESSAPPHCTCDVVLDSTALYHGHKKSSRLSVHTTLDRERRWLPHQLVLPLHCRLLPCSPLQQRCLVHLQFESRPSSPVP